jgi:hypothetical protein
VNEVVRVATPEPSSTTEPSDVMPSEKPTEPVGTPVPGATGATVAVKVTFSPMTDGLLDDVSAVVVDQLTRWVSTGEPDPVYRPSPP